MHSPCKACLLILCILLLSVAAKAQDKIYKRNGDVIEATVRSVGPHFVIFRLYNEPGGKDKSMLKLKIARIVYANGSVDIIGSGPFDRVLQVHTAHAKDTASRRMNSGRNILSAVTAYAASPIDGSINDVGVGLCYERVLDKWGHLSFNMPVMVFFSSANDYNHDYGAYSASINSYNTNGTANLCIMPGIKFYPIADNRVARYSFGLSFLCMVGSEPVAVYENNGYYGNPSSPGSGIHDYAVYGLMITNSLNITTVNHICLSLDLGIGIPVSDNRFAQQSELLGPNPIFQMGFKLGYRY